MVVGVVVSFNVVVAGGGDVGRDCGAALIG